jgi:LytS/YehU family sensor histidine kinase
LFVTIEDNGGGLKPAGRQTERRGIGLANSESRLRELYGDRGRITLREPIAGGLAVGLEIPWHRNEAAS